MCGSCSVFGLLDNAGSNYTQKIFKVLADPTLYAISTVLGLWILMKLVQAYYGEANWLQNAKTLALLFIITGILSVPEFYYEYIYELPKTVMSSLTQIFVKNSDAGITDTGYQGLVKAVDESMNRVGALLRALAKEAGLLGGFSNLIGVLVLGIPFIYLWAIFLIQVALGFFKLVLVSAFSPLLIAAWIFPASRGFAMTGFRILLSGVFGVAAAGVIMGFTFNTLDVILIANGYNPQTGQFPYPGNGFVFGAGFWMLFFVLVIASHFHRTAPSIVSQITGTNEILGGSSLVTRAAGLAGGFLAGRASAGMSFLKGGFKDAAKQTWGAATSQLGKDLGTMGKKLQQFMKHRS